MGSPRAVPNDSAMSTYRAPLRDMQFVLRELAGIDDVATLPGCEETLDVLDSVLEEAAAFASGVLDPLNRVGDRAGCTWKDGEVTTPPGFKEAYKQFADAGWIGLPVPEEYGGQGLPQMLLGPTLEMWNAANIGFANGPLLNQGAIEAIELVGSDEQKKRYIPQPRLGQMDRHDVPDRAAGGFGSRRKCEREPFRTAIAISSPAQKIFITFGEHDMAENIIHLVLARLPDAPEGTKGISLFIVPKYLVNADGTLGRTQRRGLRRHRAQARHQREPDVHDELRREAAGGAIGYLVGEPNRGLEYMFIMMNAARFSVGVQGIAHGRPRVSERAGVRQGARAGPRPRSRDRAQPVPIIQHPDVRRMLMSQKATDRSDARAGVRHRRVARLRAQGTRDEKVRKEHSAFVEFMIPIVKGWCTRERRSNCARPRCKSSAGWATSKRPGSRSSTATCGSLSIYEGTTGIQALDLVGRKLMRDMGATATSVGKKIAAVAQDARRAIPTPRVKAHRRGARLGAGDARPNLAVDRHERDGRPAESLRLLGAVPQLWGIVAGGWQMARAAQIAAGKHRSRRSAKPSFTAPSWRRPRFYADPRAVAVRLAASGRSSSGSGDVMTRERSAASDLDRKTPVTA